MFSCFHFLFVGLTECYLSCIFLCTFCGSMFVLLASLNILLQTWAYLGSSLLNEILGNSSLSTLIAVLVACCFGLRFSLDFLNFLWCKIFLFCFCGALFFVFSQNLIVFHNEGKLFYFTVPLVYQILFIVSNCKLYIVSSKPFGESFSSIEQDRRFLWPLYLANFSFKQFNLAASPSVLQVLIAGGFT